MFLGVKVFANVIVADCQVLNRQANAGIVEVNNRQPARRLNHVTEMQIRVDWLKRRIDRQTRIKFIDLAKPRKQFAIDRITKLRRLTCSQKIVRVHHRAVDFWQKRTAGKT